MILIYFKIMTKDNDLNLQEEVIRKETKEWLMSLISELKIYQKEYLKGKISGTFYDTYFRFFGKGEYRSANHLIEYVSSYNKNKAKRMKVLNDKLINYVRPNDGALSEACKETSRW